ncbi:hypothetical protein G9A89_018889 [Geosiphon pyriformis]|nr:hypothetical protein G9A89_018889 [Geosiphon pyriformis]
MSQIDFDEFLLVVKDFLDGKAAGFVVEDALEKNRKLWLVLQNMRKAYDSIDSKFMARTGKIEFNAGLIFYLAAGAFVDDTIWIGNCCTVTQKILNISSEFFDLIDISINTEKTVAIPINPRTSNTSLEVSRFPISIAKVGKAHQYLGFGISDAVRGTAAYFSDLGLHVGVEVYGLLSFTLAEMQAVALALECILVSSNVTIKSHFGVLNNKRADRLADLATLSKLVFSANIKKKFLMADGKVISGNTRHFVRTTNNTVRRFQTNLSSSVVLQSLAFSVSDVGLYTVLCKSLVFEDWLADAKASFVNTKLAMSNLVKFVRSLVVGHRE